MGLSVVLDVIIGVAFIFFLFSVIASGIHELFARALATRSKHLWRTLSELLDGDDDDIEHKELAAVAIGGLNGSRDPRPVRTGRAPGTYQEKLFAHPLVNGLDTAITDKKARLSHIEPDVFSRALLDVISGNTALPDVAAFQRELSKVPNERLRAELMSLARHADNDIGRLRNEIGDWFENRMSVLSRAYRRRTRWWLFVIGTTVALAANVDAIHVTTAFYVDEPLRALVSESAVQLAETCTFENGTPDEACQTALDSASDALDLPVWWDGTANFAWSTPLGWLIAGAAIAQGAPFWFDLLRRLAGFKKNR